MFRLAAVLASVIALALAGCGDDDEGGGGGSGSDVSSKYGFVKSGTLTVGMNLQFKPQMYLDGQGKPAGYDVDLLKRLASSLGVKLDIQNLDFNGLIPGLQSKKFDMVSVGLNATPERKKVIDFSRGYMPYAQVLAVPKGDTTAPTVDGYNQDGKTITALQGSTAETLAKKLFPKAEVKGLSDQTAAFLEVATGRADGIVVEDYLLSQFDRSNAGKLKKAEFPKPLEVQYGSWAVQKGNTAYVDYLNQFLCKEQTAGSLGSLYKKVFQVSEVPPMPRCG